ncbi:hypothetical protein [Streptococcus ovuberis]|uniref:HNH endonuclease n=1 Tax=Streptococcus ovuberis TaxID=1936207 RepID=A0A7X6MYJ7_9STRE|nr:hypothetical protein [Streptococcus ovuberis]NKZ19843.1 hypothetical protein [Streptococcus ovuberis]
MIGLRDDAYSVDLQDIYYQKVRELYLKKTSQYSPGNISDLMGRFKRLIGSEVFGDYFSGQTAEDQFKELILMPPGVMGQLVERIHEQVQAKAGLKKVFEHRSMQRLKAVYTAGQLMQKVSQGQKLNSLLTSALGLTVCPYCNRQFINNRGNKLGSEMDHFYNKDKYPIFAVSLYNLVLSCGVCNRNKGNKEFRINPFIQEEGQEHDVQFNYQLRSLTDMEIVLKSSPQRQAEIDRLGLVEAYQLHLIDVANMLDREERYSEAYRDELRELFSHGLASGTGISSNPFNQMLTDDEIDRMIYGDAIFEEDIKNIPLGKFRKDIYQELKKLRKY